MYPRIEYADTGDDASSRQTVTAVAAISVHAEPSHGTTAIVEQ